MNFWVSAMVFWISQPKGGKLSLKVVFLIFKGVGQTGVARWSYIFRQFIFPAGNMTFWLYTQRHIRLTVYSPCFIPHWSVIAVDDVFLIWRNETDVHLTCGRSKVWVQIWYQLMDSKWFIIYNVTQIMQIMQIMQIIQIICKFCYVCSR